MKQFEYTIKDKLGIHARPAGLLVKAAAKYPCTITMTKGDNNADVKKLFGLMQLCVKYGDTVQVICEGEQEEQAKTEILCILETNL